MKPTDFPHANRHLTHPNLPDLPVHSDGAVCTSRWVPDDKERRALAAGAPLWIQIVSGGTQPPIAVGLEDPLLPPGEPDAAAEPPVPSSDLMRLLDELVDQVTEAMRRKGSRDYVHRVLAAYLAEYEEALRICSLAVVFDRTVEEVATESQAIADDLRGRKITTSETMERAAQAGDRLSVACDDLWSAVRKFRRRSEPEVTAPSAM